MSRFSQEFVRKVRDAVDIREVIGEHVVLRKAGHEFVGLCPFHGEKTPSFGVNPEKKFFFCHGCKKGGDTLTFLQELLGLDFAEAVEELAERAGMPIPAETLDPARDARIEAAREKASVARRLNRYIQSYYTSILQSPEGAKIREYAEKRGAGPEIQESFRIGYAPPAWDRLALKLQAAKAPLPLARELGVIRPRSAGTPGDIDFLRERLIFPIPDARGHIVGFGGRALGEDPPKFLNSSESFLFHKGKALFGLFQAQKHLRDTGEALVVEGYFDVIALHAKGFGNAVATCGTALTTDHLRILTKLASRVTIVFDGDRAGIQATEKAMETGLENGLLLRGVSLPEGMDPDDLVLREGGAEEFRKLIENARPILEDRMHAAQKYAAKGPEERTEAIRRVVSWLKRLADPIAREVWVEEAVKLLQVPRSTLHQAGLPGGVSAPRPNPAAIPSQKLRSAEVVSRGDLLLLQAFARYEFYSNLWQQAISQLPSGIGLEQLWDSTVCKEWTVKVLHQAGILGHLADFPELWTDPLLPAEIRSTLAEALASSERPALPEAVAKALGHGLSRVWAHFSQALRTAVDEAERNGKPEEVERLLQEILDVQRKIKEFKRFYDKSERPE